MKTTFRFLLMLIIISTSYSLEPYKIIKVHDSTVYKARLSEDLKKLVVLGDNKVVNFYNTEDWTKTKSIRVYPLKDDYDVSINGDRTYWVSLSSSLDPYINWINNIDTSIKNNLRLKISDSPGCITGSINVLNMYIFDNGSIVLPFDVNVLCSRAKTTIHSGIIDSNKRLGINQICGYNYNKNIFANWSGMEYVNYGPDGRLIEERSYSTTQILDKNFNEMFSINDVKYEHGVITNNNLVCFKNDSIITINRIGKKVINHIMPNDSSYISKYYKDIKSMLPLENNLFCLVQFNDEIKLIHLETGYILGSYKNNNKIISISNLLQQNQFLAVDTLGNLLIFNLDSLINNFSIDFVSDVNSLSVPGKVKFIPYNDINSISYTWDFGDGTKSNDKEPEHVYYRPGLYDVSLEINDGSKTIKIVKKEFITAKGIKFFAEYSIDTNWTKGFPLFFENLEYNFDGVKLNVLEKDSKIIILNSTNAEMIKTKKINDKSDEIKVSPNGDAVGVKLDYLICMETFNDDICFQKIIINSYPSELYEFKFYFIPYTMLIYVDAIFETFEGSSPKFYFYYAIYDYNSGKEVYKMTQVLKTSNLAQINIKTGELLLRAYDGIYSFNPRTNILDTVLLFSDLQYPIENFTKVFLLNERNDLIFITKGVNDKNYQIFKCLLKSKNLNKVGEIASDSLDNFKFYTFIENSNNMIILRPGGQLDILDYVKNKIVDHAEIPAEFTGLSVNPKGGEFATLSDDGKVIVWKTKNIPLDKYEEPIVGNQLTVYPNPAGDYINIDFMLENNSVKTATVYSPLGNKLVEVENQTTIDISNLDNGIYFIRSGDKTAKFIKLKN